MSKIDISIIIPCYNENEQLYKNVQLLEQYLINNKNISNYEIIIVNDGSTKSETKYMLEKINKTTNATVINHTKNTGKGFAINRGICQAKYQTILFMDADLATNIKHIDDVIDKIDDNDKYMIIASRKRNGAKIITNKNYKIRKIMSSGCTWVINKMLKLNVTDSQCGFKCFDKKTGILLAQNQQIYGFAFDVEYLLIAKQNNIPIMEIPVIWTEYGDSKVKPISDTMKFIRDIFNIKRMHKN